jgi:hypothetical protein
MFRILNLRVQISTQNGKMKVLLKKTHRRINFEIRAPYGRGKWEQRTQGHMGQSETDVLLFGETCFEKSSTQNKTTVSLCPMFHSSPLPPLAVQVLSQMEKIEVLLLEFHLRSKLKRFCLVIRSQETKLNTRNVSFRYLKDTSYLFIRMICLQRTMKN